MTSPVEQYYKDTENIEHIENIENIVINPLNTAHVKQAERPAWLCKHPEAKIISYDPRKFICKKCNKRYVLKIVTQKEILGTISNNSM